MTLVELGEMDLQIRAGSYTTRNLADMNQSMTTVEDLYEMISNRAVRHCYTDNRNRKDLQSRPLRSRHIAQARKTVVDMGAVELLLMLVEGVVFLQDV